MTAIVEAFVRVRREQQNVARIAVRGVGAFEQVGLLSARGHAGGRTDPLHVEDDRRDLGVVRPAP